MPADTLELAPDDPEPHLPYAPGIALIPASDRRLHAPDVTLLWIRDGSVHARCSCWWQRTPMLRGERTAAIGHYAASDSASGSALLDHASRLLAARGCTIAIGPMDGTTWRSYRFVVERGHEPAFFLEPDHPAEWPRHWIEAGFETLASYWSALNDSLSVEDERTTAALRRLSARGLTIRPFEPVAAERDLERMFAVAVRSFADNFLFTPISKREFVESSLRLLPRIRPELVLLAEADEELAGFLLAVPDVIEQSRTGAERTVIVKTVAVDPAWSGNGLGGVLVDLAQQRARRLGFTRAVHALMHDGNRSRAISGRYAAPMRRYALFGRRLA